MTESTRQAAPGPGRPSLGREFVRGLAKPKTVGWGVLAVVLAAAGVTLLFEPAGGAGAGAVALLAFLAIVAIQAAGRIERAFFHAHADGRGLTYVEGQVTLPYHTPLLGRGSKRSSEQTLVGRLPGGIEAVLSLFVYEVVRYVDPKSGRESTSEHQYTIVAAEVPEMRRLVDGLTVERRAGPQLFDAAEDAIRERGTRVEVESAELDRRYEIFVQDEGDLNAARQIFSPSFIVWLTEQSPDMAFEVYGGQFVCAVKGHLKNAQALDALWERAGALAARLQSEATEAHAGPAHPSIDPSDLAQRRWGESERPMKRVGWVLVAVLLAAAAGTWILLDRQVEREENTPEASAREAAESEALLERTEELRKEACKDPTSNVQDIAGFCPP